MLQHWGENAERPIQERWPRLRAAITYVLSAGVVAGLAWGCGFSS